MNGKKPLGQLQTRWLNFTKELGWNHLGLYPHLHAVDLEVWRLKLELLPVTFKEKRVQKNYGAK